MKKTIDPIELRDVIIDALRNEIRTATVGVGTTKEGAILTGWIVDADRLRHQAGNLAQVISGGYDIQVEDDHDDCNTCGGDGTLETPEGREVPCGDCLIANPDGRECTAHPGVYSY
jgi:hypothetical protein